jgi:3-methyladenine DNA glycosylase AlkD
MLDGVPQPVPPLAEEILRRLRERLTAAADPARAIPMRAYMRGKFEFLGIPGPVQKSLGRQVLHGLPAPTEADLDAVARGCWGLKEREYQYFACGYLRRHIKVGSAGFLTTARHVIVTRSWWDTVDALAAHTVGPLVAKHAQLVSTMDEWIRDENMWLARTAILHQLTYKESTDATRLFHYCVVQMDHKDFFVRKAIGWALREYAKTAPEAVRSFVRAHEARLAPLSVREALKNL